MKHDPERVFKDEVDTGMAIGDTSLELVGFLSGGWQCIKGNLKVRKRSSS